MLDWSTGMPGDASRTAATTQSLTTSGAIETKFWSAHIGVVVR